MCEEHWNGLKNTTPGQTQRLYIIHNSQHLCLGWHFTSCEIWICWMSSLNDSEIKKHKEARGWTLPLHSQDSNQAPWCLLLHKHALTPTHLHTNTHTDMQVQWKPKGADDMTLFYWPHKPYQEHTWRARTYMQTDPDTQYLESFNQFLQTNYKDITWCQNKLCVQGHLYYSFSPWIFHFPANFGSTTHWPSAEPSVCVALNEEYAIVFSSPKGS